MYLVIYSRHVGVVAILKMQNEKNFVMSLRKGWSTRNVWPILSFANFVNILLKYTFNLFLNKFSSSVVLSSFYLFITNFWTSCNQCLQPSSLRVLLRVAVLSRLHLILVDTDIINRVTHKMTTYNIFQTTAWIWNSYNKIIRFQEHRCFYRNCIRQKVTPAGLGYNITLGFRHSDQHKTNLHNIREDAERKVLRESLKVLQYNINSDYRTLNQKQNTLSHWEKQHVWDNIMSRGKKMRNDLRHIHKAKLRTLMSKKARLTKRQEPRNMKPTLVKGDTTYQEPINISSKGLTEVQKSVMKKGPSFVPLPKHVDRLSLRTGLDKFVSKLRYRYIRSKISEEDDAAAGSPPVTSGTLSTKLEEPRPLGWSIKPLESRHRPQIISHLNHSFPNYKTAS